MKRNLTCLGLILICGCGPPVEETADTVILDLVDQFDEAVVFTETGLVDIGTPAARPFLTGDWSWNEKDGTGTSFVWGGPAASQISFFVAEPRPLELRFRCLPYRAADGVVDSLAVRLNSSPLGVIELVEGWNDYALALPVESLDSGINQLHFEYGWSHQIQESESEQRGRKLAVAWDWIEFPVASADVPTTDADRRLLSLTPGAQLDFFFEAPPDAELLVESILRTGQSTGEFTISTLQDGSSPHLVFSFDGVYRGRPLEGRRKRHRSLPLKEVSNRWPLAGDGGLVGLRLESNGAFDLLNPIVVSRKTSSEIGGAAVPSRPEDPGPLPPSLILLYVIDTLRADHLDDSQPSRDRSPGFAGLMRDGVVFENAFAQSTWTKPTVASILTGQLPWTHGAQNAKDVLSGDLASLAVLLQRGGFRTAAFSANGFVSEVFGFHHGFEHFFLTPEYDVPASRLHPEALKWLQDQTDQNVFLFIQTIDPHAPYAPPEPFRSQYVPESVASEVGTVSHLTELARAQRQPTLAEVEDLRNLYAGEIAAQDREFSALLEELQIRGLYDASLIIVVSDHGEEFYEHGNWTHGRTLHREVLQVPMVIKFPRGWGAGTQIRHPVQQVDVLPTILETIGVEPPAGLPGHSLLCAIREAAMGVPSNCEVSRSRPIFSSLHYHQNHWLGVIHEDWKLILPGTERLAGDAKLYDLRIDRAELNNLARDYPVRVGHLSTLIRREQRERAVPIAPAQAELDSETAARLEALGYLD